MHFPGQIHPGVPLDDVAMLERLPPDYAQLLAQRNGFVAFRGGLHVRGACRAPDWHSIRHAMEGAEALHSLFPALSPDDVPFGQDAGGDQFVLRSSGGVYRLASGAGEWTPLAPDLAGFLARCLEDPVTVLRLDRLSRLFEAGGRLAPGELLDLSGEAPRAVPARELLRELAARSRR